MDTGKTRFSLIVIALLIGTNLLWGFLYLRQGAELSAARLATKGQDVNTKIVSFSRQFVDDVLRARTEVDFETRLKLENAVREMNDKEVLAQWGKFVNSRTEAEAQDEVKSLLAMLLAKIMVQK